MRSLVLTTVLGGFCAGLLALAPGEAEGCHRRFHRGASYFAPVPVFYYAPPCLPPLYPPAVGAPASPAAVATVGAYDDYFRPQTITVPPGTTVRWTNNGRHIHTVTSTMGLFDSGDIPPGGSYTATFLRPGAFPYYCRHHTKERMVGVVVVGYGGGGGAGAGSGGSGSSGY